MHVAPGVTMLDLPFELMGTRSLIHPTVLWDADDVVLVDTGIPGSAAPIRAAAAQASVPFERLNHIILTHDDIDHIGSLGDLLQATPGPVEVLAHQADAAAIEQGRPGKMTPERLASLPEERRRVFEAVLQRLHSQQVRVTRRLTGGEWLSYCGGIRVLHTPGHTLGHISLYHEPSRTLVAGDALAVDGGVLRPSAPGQSQDAGQAVASATNLAALDIAAVICYHGGLYQDAPSAALRALGPSPAS